MTEEVYQLIRYLDRLLATNILFAVASYEDFINVEIAIALVLCFSRLGYLAQT